jgi:nucleotide-binding universal stress UspA family protein
MSEPERRRSEREARRDAGTHPSRPHEHEDDVLRRLAAESYQQRKRDHLHEAPAPSAPQEPLPPSLVTVAVDESAGAVAAIDEAATEASLRGWELRLVHVQGPGGGEHAAADHERGVALLAKLADHARTRTATAVSSELCVGSTVEVLIDHSARSGLLVLGSRGLGPVRQMAAGSVSIRVAAGAHSPVVVVPPSSERPAPSTLLSIVVGVDGSAESAMAAEFAAEEARLRGVPLTAVHATTTTPPASEVLSSGPLDPARDPGVNVERHSVPAGAAEALIDASASARTIVVGTRGSGGVRGVRLGSTSKALLRHARCPVVVVPPGAFRSAA